MYDLDGTDTNREWVEVKNSGEESADLSKWFLFSDNSKHALTPQGSSDVPSGGYAVITQNPTNFQADWPNYTGLIFDSSWTGFNNETGETISLKDSNLTEFSITIFDSSMGGAGDGNSVQKLASGWAGAVPTPGKENQASSPVDINNEENGGNTSSGGGVSSSTSVITKAKEVELTQMTTNIISKNTAFAGIPFLIDTNTTGYSRETLKVGSMVWNFGDGMSRKSSDHLPFEYIYQYPGEYVMTLSYYYPNDNIVDATDRMIIKVVAPGVIISSVGTNVDPYVEIENKSGVEVDLSGWVINGASSSFRIPEGMIILPSKSVRLSGRVTGFSVNDLSYVNILSNGGEVVASYPTIKTITYKSTSSISPKSRSTPVPKEIPTVINLDDLGASAGNSDVNISTSTYAIGGLVVVIAIGLLSVYFAKKNNVDDDTEQGIRAEDIKIIE
jgi:hypothetical protein